MLQAVKGEEPIVYVGDNGRGTVTVFAQSKPSAGPIGKISGLSSPTGLAVDQQGDLFVQVAGAIDVFHRGATTPYKTLAIDSGAGITFDSRGDLYATSGNEVDVFPPGASKPKQRLVDPQLLRIWEVAVDDAGDVFCSGYFQYSSGPEEFAVDEFLGGTSKVRRITSLGYYGGLAIGANQELLVQDGSGFILTFPKPYKKPESKVLNYGEIGFAMAVSSTLKSVWIASTASPFGQGQQFSLSSGRRTHETKHGGMSSQVFGIALDPAAM